jgi:hypothetical protein
MSDKASKLPAIVPPEILEILGTPPLLPTEDERVYNAALALYAQIVRPGHDLFLWEYITDLVCSRTDVARYRRMKVELIRRAAYAGALSTVDKLNEQLAMKVTRLKELGNSEKSEAVKPTTVAEQFKAIDDLLKSGVSKPTTKTSLHVREEADQIVKDMAGLLKLITHFADPRRVQKEGEFAAAIDRCGDSLETVDLLLLEAQKRFQLALADIERYKRGLGDTIRRTMSETIDGECVELDQPGSSESIDLAVATPLRGVVAPPSRTLARRRGSNHRTGRRSGTVGSKKKHKDKVPDDEASCA